MEANLDNVEGILGKRVIDDEVQYKIQWKKLPKSESTWVPISKLTKIKHLINSFDGNDPEYTEDEQKNTGIRSQENEDEDDEDVKKVLILDSEDDNQTEEDANDSTSDSNDETFSIKQNESSSSSDDDEMDDATETDGPVSEEEPEGEPDARITIQKCEKINNQLRMTIVHNKTNKKEVVPIDKIRNKYAYEIIKFFERQYYD